MSETRARRILQQMTLEEKASMLTGRDFWHLEGIERLGIEPIRCTDGPHGVTVCGELAGPATCFPTGIGMASTWDTELIYRVGQALGRETRARGCHILLAPMVNIHRTPVNGRNYETYSEDPHLAARLSVAFCQGVQSQQIGACVKALAANNQQKDQNRTSAEVDERALREIYLPAFEQTVLEARPWGVMTSYNLLNGLQTSEHPQLLREIVKQEWGFEGFIVSDWRAVRSLNAFDAGLDLEMPGPGKVMTREAILAGIESGRFSEAELDDKVLRLLRAIVKSGAADRTSVPGAGAVEVELSEKPSELDSPRHRALAREVAEGSLVLLKNENGLLPFDLTQIKRLAVIGPNARVARIGGGGSASVTPFYAVSPWEGLRNLYGDRIELVFEEGCSLIGGLQPVGSAHLRTAAFGGRPGLRGEYFSNDELAGEPALVRIDSEMDFSWGWNSPGGGVKKEGFSVRWTGVLNVPEPGDYRLGVSFQDGGCRLYVGGELVIDTWQSDDEENCESRYRAQSRSIERTFTEGGAVPIRIEYRKFGNKASVRLEWETPAGDDALEKAVRAARGADAVVLCVGLSHLFEGGTHDRERLELPEAQNALIKAIAVANPRTAVVLFNGTPVGMTPWLDHAGALIEAWYAGQEGGHALARVLFGEVNPSGKLPDTLPRRIEDNPAWGARRYPGIDRKAFYEEGVFVGYRHYDRHGIEPAFPFGFGLSYTSFAYRNLRLSSDEMGPSDTLRVNVDVMNTGRRTGREIVQLYVGDVEASVERPPLELKGFVKVTLEPGETKTVTLPLTVRDLSFYDVIHRRVRAEPGQFLVQVGPHSRSGLRAGFRYRE